MKHAYLIIAHHEFEVLHKLVEALDDHRNDIYIHFDKKVKKLPGLQCCAAKLFILENRVDVRWGHVSQIESEYALFETAYNSKESYQRYHLISGTHLPLKRQQYIHDFFETFKDNELLNFLITDPYEVNFKLNRYHYFLKNFRAKDRLLQRANQFLWRLCLKTQSIVGVQGNNLETNIKANNWVSLTNRAVGYLLNQKTKALKLFRRSFCGDEYFVPYLLQTSNEEFEIVDEERLLFNEFVGSTPRILTDADYDFLIESDYLFARKFSSADSSMINRIVDYVRGASE